MCPAHLLLDTGNFSADNFSALCRALSRSAQRLSSLAVNFSQVTEPGLVDLGLALQSNRSVLSLGLHAPESCLAKVLAAVAQCLAPPPELLVPAPHCRCSPSSAGVGGTCCSAAAPTITELAIRTDNLDFDCASWLAHILCRNKSLVRISMVFESMSSGPACLNMLARGLSYNGYVVKLTMTDSRGADWTTTAISRIVLRNCVMLDRAATFVLRSKVDRRGATDFLYLQASASLIPHVVILSGGKETESSAADAVQFAKCRLRGRCNPPHIQSVSSPILTWPTVTSLEERPQSCKADAAMGASTLHFLGVRLETPRLAIGDSHEAQVASVPVPSVGEPVGRTSTRASLSQPEVVLAHGSN
ncbi:uncharacterized protein LOC144165783 [Haemaphysalis longicornis]